MFVNKYFISVQLFSDLSQLLKEPDYHSQYSVWLRVGRPGDRGSIPGRGKGFFLYPLCPDRIWGPTQPRVQWVSGVLSPGVKARPGHDVDHSPPSSAEVNE
jgi:hypothetical protein